MADYIHQSLAAFRETMLTGIARLEFQIRDFAATSSSSDSSEDKSSIGPVLEETLLHLARRLDSIEASLQHRLPAVVVKEENSDETLDEIIKMEQPSTTRNILVQSVRSTPALAAAVAAASAFPPALDLLDSETIASKLETDDGGDESSGPDFQQIVIKGKPYYMDSEMCVYKETDEGYEQIGKYDSVSDTIIYEEEEQEEETQEEHEGEVLEEEEESPDLEQFTWKGNTYYKDVENSVYRETDEGYEQIGTWNGKKVILDE
jgi:hypothetical protein